MACFCGDYPLAFFFCQVSHSARRITQYHDASHALRVALGGIADDAHNNVCLVVSRPPISRLQGCAAIEVVFSEASTRLSGGVGPAHVLKGFDDFDRVHEPASPQADDLLRQIGQWPHRALPGSTELEPQPNSTRVVDGEHPGFDVAVGVAHP